MEDKLECYEDLIHYEYSKDNQQSLLDNILIPMRTNFFELFDGEKIVKRANHLTLSPMQVGEKPELMDEVILLVDETVSTTTKEGKWFFNHEFLYAKGGFVSFIIQDETLHMFVTVDEVRIGYDFSKFWTEVCFLCQKMFSVLRKENENLCLGPDVDLTINKAVMYQENWYKLANIMKDINDERDW